MNEEMPENENIPEDDVVEETQDDFDEPPRPEDVSGEAKEEPEMSEASTLANIFFEPGRTFSDLRKKPRFILGFVIIALMSTAFLFAFNQKMGDDRIRRFVTEQAEKNSGFANLPEDQKKSNIDLQMSIQKIVRFALPVFVLIGFLIGSLIYWLGIKALGGTASYLHAFSVWVYSSLPPTVVSLIANFIVLFLKSADEIDIATSQRGVIQANPTLFFDGKDMPVLTTIISSIDLFTIWGLILAAIGLQKVAKLSKGGAWGIVLILALIGITFRVIFALINGIPQ